MKLNNEQRYPIRMYTHNEVKEVNFSPNERSYKLQEENNRQTILTTADNQYTRQAYGYCK